MASKANICNMALGLLGVTTQIADLSNPTNDAEISCNLWWDQCVNEMLERNDWKFARGYVQLASTTAPSDEYDYAYQLPTNCLVVRYLWDVDAGVRVTDYEYELFGSMLCTKLEEVYLVYTKTVTDTGKFPAFFVRALIYLLAHYLAPKHAEKGGKAKEMFDDYEKSLARAIEIDASQQNYIESGDDSWMTAGGFTTSESATEQTEVYVVE